MKDTEAMLRNVYQELDQWLCFDGDWNDIATLADELEDYLDTHKGEVK